MKINQIGLLLCVFIFSCQNDVIYKNKYTLKSSNDSINIKLGSSSTNRSNCIQFLESNDTDFLAVLTGKSTSIELYNLNTRKLHNVIDFKNEGPDAFLNTCGFVMRNIDTLLVVGGAPQQVGMIDNRGKVLRRISFERDINGRKVNASNASLGMRPFIVGDSVYLIPYFNPYASSGILTSTSQENSPVNIAINFKTGESKVSSLKIPSELIGEDITGIHVWRTLGNSNCFVYSYSIIEGLFITHNHLSFDKLPIETNYKFKLKKNLSKYSSLSFNKGMQFYFSHDEVINIHYDVYRECYYIIVNQRIDEYKENTDYRLFGLYPSFFIIILDKKFKHLGEVYFPDDTFNCQMMFVASEGLFISEDHVNNPTFSEDFMRFRLFTLEKISNRSKK